MKFDVVIVGVGGQGVLLASEVLSEVALKEGYDVKKSEIHGMAQRGGSVFSFVRIGEKVFSPIIPMGSADIMLAFEELEAIRYVPYMKIGSNIVLNRQRIAPITVLSGDASYPENTVEILSRDFKVHSIDGIGIAKRLGDPRVTNMVLLGYMARRFMPLGIDIWLDTIRERVPERHRDKNIEAFMMGWNHGEGEV